MDALKIVGLEPLWASLFVIAEQENGRFFFSRHRFHGQIEEQLMGQWWVHYSMCQSR